MANRADSSNQTDNDKIQDNPLTIVVSQRANELRKMQEIKKFLKEQSADEGVISTYQKWTARMTTELEPLKDMEKKYSLMRAKAQHKENRFNQPQKLRTLENVSAADKNHIGTMISKVTRYERHIRSAITDQEIEQHYQQLVQQKDKRLVDVHVFQYRHLWVTSNDQQTVSRATKLLVNDEPPPTGLHWLITPESDRFFPVTDDPGDSRLSWSTLESLDEVKRDPSSITKGTMLIEESGPIGILYPQSYLLRYIVDKKFYPLIGIDEDTVHKFTTSFLRAEIYTIKMENVYKSLRADSVVTLNGNVIAKATDYPQCPSGQ